LAPLRFVFAQHRFTQQVGVDPKAVRRQATEPGGQAVRAAVDHEVADEATQTAPGQRDHYLR
jgi:hypothetical protein